MIKNEKARQSLLFHFVSLFCGAVLLIPAWRAADSQSASRLHTSGWRYHTHTRPGRLKRLLHSVRFLQPLISNTDTLCDWVITCQTCSRAVTRHNYAVLLFFLLSLRSNNKETWRATAQPGWSFGGRRNRLPWPTGYVSMETVASVIGRNLRLDLHHKSWCPVLIWCLYQLLKVLLKWLISAFTSAYSLLTLKAAYVQRHNFRYQTVKRIRCWTVEVNNILHWQSCSCLTHF